MRAVQGVPRGEVRHLDQANVPDRLDALDAANELMRHGPEPHPGVYDAPRALAAPRPLGYTHRHPDITREWAQRPETSETFCRRYTLKSQACRSTPLGSPQWVAGGDLAAFAVQSDHLESQ